MRNSPYTWILIIVAIANFENTCHAMNEEEPFFEWLEESAQGAQDTTGPHSPQISVPEGSEYSEFSFRPENDLITLHWDIEFDLRAG